MVRPWQGVPQSQGRSNFFWERTGTRIRRLMVWGGLTVPEKNGGSLDGCFGAGAGWRGQEDEDAHQPLDFNPTAGKLDWRGFSGQLTNNYDLKFNNHVGRVWRAERKPFTFVLGSRHFSNPCSCNYSRWSLQPSLTYSTNCLPANVCANIQSEGATLYMVIVLPFPPVTSNDSGWPRRSASHCQFCPQFLPIGIHPVFDPFTFTASTSPSAATLVISTWRKLGPPVMVNRIPPALSQLTLHHNRQWLVTVKLEYYKGYLVFTTVGTYTHSIGLKLWKYSWLAYASQIQKRRKRQWLKLPFPPPILSTQQPTMQSGFRHVPHILWSICNHKNSDIILNFCKSRLKKTTPDAQLKNDSAMLLTTTDA